MRMMMLTIELLIDMERQCRSWLMIVRHLLVDVMLMVKVVVRMHCGTFFFALKSFIFDTNCS